ncbi:3'(2'),5'-bisphosphate nucleotidase CysQ [Amorphus sp. MBR-141]
MTRPRVTDLLPAAIEAGDAILRFYAAGTPVETKVGGSPVTEADRAAEAIILRHLRAIAPDIPVIAEEEAAAGRVPDTGGTFFLVDPLDGTKEFIRRNGEFTVNIALVVDHAPAWGIVTVPVTGEAFFGTVGEGAFAARLHGAAVAGERPIAVRAVPAVGPTVLASRSHRLAETDAFIARVDAAEIVSAGSSLKFCRIAAGAADLYPRHGPTMEWDTAAGDAVLRAAGGVCTTFDGVPLAYGKRGRAGVADFLNPSFVAAGQPVDQRVLAG